MNKEYIGRLTEPERDETPDRVVIGRLPPDGSQDRQGLGGSGANGHRGMGPPPPEHPGEGDPAAPVEPSVDIPKSAHGATPRGESGPKGRKANPGGLMAGMLV
jgi:hypothetical protein